MRAAHVFAGITQRETWTVAGETGGVSKASSLSRHWPRAPLFLQAGRQTVLGARRGEIFALFTNLCVCLPALLCLWLIRHLGT